MATMDDGSRTRDILPSISHFDLDRINSEKNDHSRFSMMNGLSISTAPLASPTTTMYSGPPPPYSCASSTAGSASGLSGYISPPESTTRRSTRDDKDSPGLRKSLPSIHEALADNSISFPAPLSSSSQHQSLATPSTAVGQSFTEGPRRPVNPFSQPSSGPPVLRDVFAGTHKSASGPVDTQTTRSSMSAGTAPDPRQPASQHFSYPTSPRSHPPSSFRSSSLTNTSFNNHNEHPPARSPQAYEQPRPPFPFPQIANPAPSNYPPAHEPFQFSAGQKPEDTRGPHPRPDSDIHYSDTVKRHLDVFDTEMGLNEISEASARTLDFARIWAQRYHQGSRSGYFHESLPGIHEVDDILRQSHRIFENLTHLREVVVAQQTAISEHRARLARTTQMEDDYHGISDEYRGVGYGPGDGKKPRRGKAAPPGRCHSCNRAETPEWRRGPDGARTLCNACGLHYAKLTRKMGVNKAAALTGSNLRPKHLDPTRP
ncbi:uncharacterized protein Z518_02217 [Rhinocladiella mackenziei CBS 650.93]|uniref:GATA-type domain-containing protein n=1 Tax=Rhinocladiella mackenziei CBS 650.93 TaxID=1442369 RepID=A0A0D2IP18_9EURO|nr:uncharacterized protein Z518_02217 [Rhinocladiella mackenziei CBS 650.93]KIX07564.1 hypothetical protein Z518_02217 [Rhinocladiella mackenziei CBS 650.93]